MAAYKFKDVNPVRSRTMRAIRSMNTSSEMILRKELFKRGVRFRVHYDKLPGKPDIVIMRSKVAVFCDGEFWHGKDWNIKKDKIKKNRDYWVPKIEKNIIRDRQIKKTLELNGWLVLRFWEKDIKNNLGKVADEIISNLEKRKKQSGVA